MKKMNARARIAALAAASLASALGMAPMAQAQPLFEFRTWSAPRYYEDAPRVYRQAPPRYVVRAALPRRAIRRIVESQGYDVIGPIQLSGQVYLVPVEDMRGRVSRLVVDARDGEIIDRAGVGGPPRPPANVGRARERYAATPGASRLPPLPLEPYGRWGGYEYEGPIFPDGGYAPRMDEFDVEPGLGPVPPPPAPRASERARPSRQRPAAKAQKPARKQQAARSPAAQKPAAPSQAAPSPSRPAEATAKPDAKPETQAVVKPDAKPDVRPEVRPESVSRPDESSAPKTSAPKAPAPAAKREPMLPKSSPPEPRSEQARRAAEKRNAAILRRPGSKDEARSGERPGGSVAGGPTISTGADPQRASPRVVYPGPGAPAPEPSPTPAD